MDPAFFRLDKYFEIFINKTNTCLGEFRKNEGIIKDIQDVTQKLTLDVLGLSIFGKDFDSLNGKLEKDLESYNFIMDNIMDLSNLLKNTIFSTLPTSYNKKVNQELNNFDKTIYKLIDEAKNKMKKGETPTSMLDFMVKSTTEKNEDETGNFLTETELRDNVIVFFFAGHDTTSSALSFAINLLARNEEVQEKARKEINEVFGNEEFSQEKMSELKYVTAIIRESMRLYTPVGQLDLPARRVTKNTILGDWKLPKGTLIIPVIYTSHNDERYYKDAKVFKPERWLNNEAKLANWFPFSAGPRFFYFC
jgi:cytochrome P450